MDIDTLLKLQEDICERLKKAHSNYKKSPKSRIKQHYIETKLQALEEINADFKQQHRDIISGVTAEEKATLDYFKRDIYEWFQEEYAEYKSLLKESLASLITSTTVSENSNSMEDANVTADVKLPRIELPTFSGKYEEWQPFHDMFSSLIHNNNKLSPVQKLHYLKISLSGEAERLIINLSLIDKNYEEAWKQLKKRYNNKRHNSNAIFKILFGQKSVNVESASSIKSLLDTTSSCLKALQNLGISTESWDSWLIYFIVTKMDIESHKQWENHLNTSTDTGELPTWIEMTDFLEARFRSLEVIESSKTSTNTNRTQQNNKQVIKTKSFHSEVQEEKSSNETTATCPLCDEKHLLHQCKKYSQKSILERIEFVQSKGLCFNCLSPTHVVFKCRQSSCCKKCGRRHHTTIHKEKEGTTHEAPKRENVQISNIEKPIQSHSAQVETNVVTNFAKEQLQSYDVLLATAVVKVESSCGKKNLVRALLDQGSQASFVTQSTVQLLGLKSTPVNGVVSGLGDGQQKIKRMVRLILESRHNPEISIQVNAYVLGSLTSMLPSRQLREPKWFVLKDLELADPGYATPGRIDILLGADVYSEILLDGLIKDPQGNLIAQQTVLGWVISGKMSGKLQSASEDIVSMHIQVREHDFLRKFWEIEAEPDSIQKKLNKEEIRCEELYNETTVRNEEGRFVVKLPFKSEDPACQYGESKEIALRKLLALEKRLLRDPNLYKEYKKVLNEYVELNHMALVKEEEINNPKAVYLPHHAVVREDKLTTKVRVVFNASSKGVNNVSLNDDLLVGPKLQQDLRHLLMRWRTHKICIIADLVKMYRQVRVAEKDTNFQRILWRPEPNMPIQHYKLLTLTFGTASAPYLAVKTLMRLAEEEQARYPTAAEITKNDYYIDDLMTGCNTEAEAKEIYTEMNNLMNSGGFQLQKWSSNSEELLTFIGKSNNEVQQSIPIQVDHTLKVLGIQWNRETDNFEYTVNLPEATEPITKRQVLSDIARLYDPMGWIAPVVIAAKIIIQNIWKAKLDWDDPLPNELLSEWLRYRDELTQVKNIMIPRWLHYTPNCDVELHAFSDASRAAYAATVYIRVTDNQGTVHTNLVSAKTKVAPIEKELSIPRLELCGAALAAKLISEISQVMKIPKEKLFAWTDSTVVLAWLKGGSSKWTTFVSNRVSEILTILDYEQWSHVATDSNPSDCASRGLRPAELKDHSLWWSAPSWLQDSNIEKKRLDIETHEEERITTMKITQNLEDNFEWTKFSNLNKMLRVISYCKRTLFWTQPKEERNKLPNYITSNEINNTLEQCIRQVQEIEFKEEIQNLKNNRNVATKSILHTLYPFLDQNGILRVGGRIDQAHVSYDKRHPFILPAKSHLTWLIIMDAHSKTLHGGPQLMLNFLRAKFWIIRARDLVKKCYRKCLTCLRHAKTTKTQLMGQLPEVRLKPSKPFKSTGVDYAGPINIRFSPGRGSKSYKGYISLFVCMVTRAIHLEAVTELTSKAFIAAFRRFTARRGHCQDLYSDNGTNFVGADKQLRDMFNRAKSHISEEISRALTLESTNWHFIPPHAPNFGGLWEAGVRSAKIHLRKVIGDSTLTYEELSTVLSQVEACLNSRPISILSDNPDDPLPLTPGHFLVGEPLLNIVDEDYSDKIINHLERWNMVQKMVYDFWKRWSKEYLVNLSQRYKWNSKKTEPEVNDIVILREDNLPPSKWMLGVIVNKHTGPDNVTRVVTVKCKNGVFKRPLSKLITLEK